MSDKETGHLEHSGRADNLGILPAVNRPLKIVFLGAGSFFFNSLFVDVMNIPGADSGEMVLVDIDETRLALAQKFGVKAVEEMSKSWTVTATTDRRRALKNADYIISCIEVSGQACVRLDYDIPAKYGVDQCIGDTGGPGGLMKALRTVPVFLDVLKDVEELAPNAWVMNYTNPMSILCLASARASKAKVVGLCHSVQGTSRKLADYAGVAYQDMKWRCGGVNHIAWFTELSANGQDLYPVLLDKAVNDKETYEKDPVRFDMMRHLGYFVTESSGHFSEYVPYYRKRPGLIEKHCRKGDLGESSYYANGWPSWRVKSDDTRSKQIAGEEKIDTARSWEYASYIIEAMETNSPFVFYGTVPNTHLIENLPVDGVVEVPCLVDNSGISPTHFGTLPPQCAAICDWNMRFYDLAATACIEKSREAAIHALMLDPLTAAVCSPGEIRQMAEELFKAEKDFLPGF